MKQQPINYKDVISLGFKRIEGSDTVWTDQHGYDYFMVEMKLAKRFCASWDNETHMVEIRRFDKDHSIVGRLPVEDLAHLKLYLGLFKEIVEPEQDSSPPIQRYA